MRTPPQRRRLGPERKIQQRLGRGLRLAEGKDHLRVIDFIGNYTNNYMIPMALFGDSSLSKDQLRRQVLGAQTAGAISGLSSVNFDGISRGAILRSISDTNLDSLANLKTAYREMHQRLGQQPWLMDFARFETVQSYYTLAGRDLERELAPMRSWSTITAAERFSSESTSGRGLAGMNCWTKDG